MSNIFLNYDINRNNIYNKFKNSFYIKFNRSKNENDPDFILFFDKNKKLISNHKFEINGIYIHKFKTWIWSWAMPYLKQKMISNSRKILNYGLDLGSDINDIRKIFFITSRFKLPNQYNVDYINAISLELVKNNMIYELKLKISDEIIKQKKIKKFDIITFESFFKDDTYIDITDDNNELNNCITFYLFIQNN